MRISGVQYYWLVFAGLSIGLVLFLVISFGPETITEHAAFPIVMLIIVSPVLISSFIAVLEIWKRFGLLPAIVSFLLSPLLIVYWLSRIKGIEERPKAD